jgi:hypothetical protein
MDKEYWYATLGALAAIDIYAAHVKHDGTLSQAGRYLFKTHTKRGKIAWCVAWAGLSAWLVPHISHVPERIADAIS